jgi:hypothetical protein
MFRPQFPLPAPPPGYVWQPCVYQFDKSNVPAFAAVTLVNGEESGHIPLKVDKDASFVLLAVKILFGGVNILLFDPWSDQLMDDYVNPQNYASNVVPATTLEGGNGLQVPAGSVFQVRLQGQ